MKNQPADYMLTDNRSRSMKIISVLLVDDDEDDYFLTKACLDDIVDQKFEVTWSSSFEQARLQLAERHFDICFFDYLLGAGTGLDLLRIAQDLRVQTPIILLTGRGDTGVAMKALALGGTDYLVKRELEPEKLSRSIRYAIEHTATLKQLKENEEKYRGLFEGSVDAICLLNADGQFTDVNDAATRLLGYTKGEFLTKNITDLFEEENHKALFANRIAAGKNIRDFETKLAAADGESRYCIIACTIHHLPGDREKKFYQGILHDITRRKKAEQDLVIADKMAAAGRLLRMLGHEIRNPLTNIDLAIGQLIADNRNDELNDLVEIIQRNSKRIGQLLTDLLQAANPGQLRAQSCSPVDLLDETLALAADRIALKNIRVEKDYASDLRPVQADPQKMKIALLNIIINAVEIMEANRGVLSLGIRPTTEGCRIVIRDNGPGISPENRKRIFEPYFSRKTNGMGLGLASTLNIVQLHSGRIEVYSEVGQGAEFAVWLMA